MKRLLIACGLTFTFIIPPSLSYSRTRDYDEQYTDVKIEKAIAAATTHSGIADPLGNFNIIITGTWVGTIKVLKRFDDLKTKGTHTGANDASTLTYASLGATADEFIGMWISNDTQGGFGAITDNDGTTITATLDVGDWDTGDEFSLWYELSSHTANTITQITAVEPGVSYIFVPSAWTSGTARVRISQ